MSSRKLVSKLDIDNLLKEITNPRVVCQYCRGKEDCIGIEECYPAQDYLVIEYKITQPTQAEIVRLVNS